MWQYYLKDCFTHFLVLVGTVLLLSCGVLVWYTTVQTAPLKETTKNLEAQTFGQSPLALMEKIW